MKTGTLKRTIGLASATSIGLGAMLGAGIFVFPGLAGGYTGAGAILSFLIGGGIALLVAACTAELATAMPQSGGGYYFISRSYGKFWGTMVGIAQWVGLIFACAFYLVSFGEYALTLLEEYNIRWDAGNMLVPLAFTIILLVINLLGTKRVGRFQNFMVISLTVVMVLIFSYGLVDFLGLENNTMAPAQVAPNGIKPIFTTAALIFTSYLGFVQIANIGAEIKRPDKFLPRSLIGSVLIAMVLYTFVMLTCTIVFPSEELKRFGETATIEVARYLLGKWGAVVVLFAALLAALSSANASVISASRGVFALSKDNVISKKASAINERFGTPHVALILVALPVAIMLMKRNLEVFAEVASFLHLVIYAGICLSVFKLRTTQPAWYIPTFRLKAARVLALAGAGCCILLVFFMQTKSILIGVAVLALTALYFIFIVKRRQVAFSLPDPPHINLEFLRPRALIPVDLTKEKKDLPQSILTAIPISKMLILGYKETPEQSQGEQVGEEQLRETEEKLENIITELKKTDIEFDTEIVFSNKVVEQMNDIIQEENFPFILKLRPFSEPDQMVIPIYDPAQIREDLSTVVYKLHTNRPTKIKVVLFTGDEDSGAGEIQLKKAVERQLGLVNIKVDAFETQKMEKGALNNFAKERTATTDLVIWSEASPSQRDLYLKIILERESEQETSPAVLILHSDETGDMD